MRAISPSRPDPPQHRRSPRHRDVAHRSLRLRRAVSFLTLLELRAMVYSPPSGERPGLALRRSPKRGEEHDDERIEIARGCVGGRWNVWKVACVLDRQSSTKRRNASRE